MTLLKSMLLKILLIVAALPLLRAQAVQPEGDSARTGQRIFSSTCSGCHGLDGRGGEHAPNIATTQKVQQFADSDIIRIIDKGIPSAGMPAFGTSLTRDQIQAVVVYLRTLGGRAASELVAGNPGNGQALFFSSAKCSDCHMMNGRGGFIAADLSSYGANHTAEQIRNTIVNPAGNAGSNRKPVVVAVHDGRTYRGMVRNEDNFSLQLQSMDGAFHFFEKSSIASVETQAKPLMPDNYGSTLSASHLDDLVSYLIANAKNKSAVQRDSDDDF